MDENHGSEKNNSRTSTVVSTPEASGVSLLQRKTMKKMTLDRTAMGEYIHTKDGKPLTQLAIPMPGPADYSPQCSLTKQSHAQYSIVGKPKPFPSENNFPGPNKYSTDRDMVWRDRGFPMIGKGRAEEHSTCSLGPAAYHVKHANFGSSDAKISLGLRPDVHHGPPHTLVHPVDTHKFETVGPAEYRPSSAHWGNNIERSFGLSLRKERSTVHPGPAEYDIRGDDSKLRGPAYSLAKRLPMVTGTQDDTPGPGAYDIGTTIGNAVAKSITSRQPFLENLWAPAPNTYSIPSSLGEAAKCSMTYQAFEKRIDPHPSPAAYKPNLTNLQKAANHSCRKVCRPVYPDILNYAEYDLMKNQVVGPGRYDHKKEFSKNDAPSYSMGSRMKPNSGETPGPASYKIKVPTRPDAKRAPAFPMGVRIESKRETVGPGPAAYHLQNSRGTCKSMSSRNKKHQAQSTPAPNAYLVRAGQTNYGSFKGPQATLKGRPSPFMYSGFRRIVR